VVPLVAGQQTITANGTSIRVTTTRMKYTDLTASRGPGAYKASFAFVAEPLSSAGAARGRAVVAMVQVSRPPTNPLQTNITSALTLGGDLDVNGNAFTVNGRYSGCGVAGGVDAVRSSATSDIDPNNETHMDNFKGVDDAGNVTNGDAAIDKTNLTREQLADNVLKGGTLEDLIASLPDSVKYGPRFDNRVWDKNLDNGQVVAVIDGNGGNVEIQSGTGVVIIVNGNLLMDGNSSFRGIIIVEGNFSLSGTPDIDGALISLSDTGNNTIDQSASAIAQGNITVQFDKCAIDAAQAAFGQVAVALPSMDYPAFAWFEMVR
jgi:hypothetical protein